MECYRTPFVLFLSQQKYIRNLLLQLKMDGVKPVSSPMATSCKLSNIIGKSLSDPFVYRSMVGALQYLSFTRPDIAFSVNKVPQLMQAPTDEHWSAVKRILRYLKSIIQYGLFLSRHSSVQLTSYTDADWAGSIDDWKPPVTTMSSYKYHFLELEEAVYGDTIQHWSRV